MLRSGRLALLASGPLSAARLPRAETPVPNLVSVWSPAGSGPESPWSYDLWHPQGGLKTLPPQIDTCARFWRGR